jgi:dienelactone hydrolase
VRRVTTVVLFHSVYGLRPAVLAAADRLRAAGHTVVAPDLYAGPVAASIDEGFALSARIGWETIVSRARHAVRDLPTESVLAGLSMGVGVVGALLAGRPETAGLLLLHGTGGEPADVPAGLPVHVHIAEPDNLFPLAGVAAWRDAMAGAGAAVRVHTYPGAGHLFTDPDTTDFDRPAAELAWQRSLAFLGSL